MPVVPSQSSFDALVGRVDALETNTHPDRMPELAALADRVAALEAMAVAPQPEPTPESEPTPAPSGGVGVDWSTATGNSVEAVTDGGKAIAPRHCSSTWPQVLSVEAGVHPLGVNALGIRSIQGCGHVEFVDAFPTPAAGQVWTIGYDIMQETGQTDTKQHPMCFWPVGTAEPNPIVAPIQAVHMAIEGRGGGAWTPWPRFPWGSVFPYGVKAYLENQPLVVQSGQWVRYEFDLEWTSPTSYVPRMRLLNLDGSVLTTDFRGTEWPFAPAEAVANCTNPQAMRTISFGMGQAGSSGARYFVARVRLGVA